MRARSAQSWTSLGPERWSKNAGSAWRRNAGSERWPNAGSERWRAALLPHAGPAPRSRSAAPNRRPALRSPMSELGRWLTLPVLPGRAPATGSDRWRTQLARASLSPSARSGRWSIWPAQPGLSPAGSKRSSRQVGQVQAKVPEPGQKSAQSEHRTNAGSEHQPQRAESELLSAMSLPSAGRGAKALAAEASRRQARLSPKADSGRGRPARPAESWPNQGSSRCRASSALCHARTPGAPARGGLHAAPSAPHPPRVRPPWRAHARRAAAC